MISEVLGRVTDWMGLRVNEMENRAGNWVTGCDRKYFEVPVGPWEMSVRQLKACFRSWEVRVGERL